MKVPVKLILPGEREGWMKRKRREQRDSGIALFLCDLTCADFRVSHFFQPPFLSSSAVFRNERSKDRSSGQMLIDDNRHSLFSSRFKESFSGNLGGNR